MFICGPVIKYPLAQSATSPNREEFAEWVGRTKSKRVYVLETSKRPVRRRVRPFGYAPSAHSPSLARRFLSITLSLLMETCIS